MRLFNVEKECVKIRGKVRLDCKIVLGTVIAVILWSVVPEAILGAGKYHVLTGIIKVITLEMYEMLLLLALAPAI